jgi:hypothetical protein
MPTDLDMLEKFAYPQLEKDKVENFQQGGALLPYKHHCS